MGHEIGNTTTWYGGRLSSLSGSPKNVTLLHAPLGLRTNSRTLPGLSRDCQDSVFDTDWPFLANIFGQALREDLNILVWSTNLAFVAFTLRGFGSWEVIWADRAHDKRRWLEKSINNLSFQRDTYLIEVQKVFTSLQEVNKFMDPFNLPGTLGSSMMHLGRVMERKIVALEST